MYRQRSFFFPMLLIAVGVLWLLVSLGLMPAGNFWALTHVWPYLLIALGISLILRGQWPEVAPYVAFVIIGGLMASVIYAPQLGWDRGEFWQWDLNISGSISGSGNIDTETRSLGDFHSIDLRYPADVVIEVGDSPSITIQADDNLLPQLSTDVRGGTLVIDNEQRYWSNRVNPSQTVEITITVTELDRVTLGSAGQIVADGLQTDRLVLVLGGAGNIRFTNLEAESLDASVNGLGNIEVSGTATDVEVGISGSGDFEGADLQSETASVQINGLGSATVRVSEHLDAQINGAGSVHYYGSPSVRENVNGLGSVDKSGD